MFIIVMERIIMMENRDDLKTLKLLVFGVVIWFVLISIPVIIITSDKIRGELGLLVGSLMAVAMAVSMNMAAAKSLYMEKHQSAFLAWCSVGRLLVVVGVVILFGFTGWLNIVTMLIGVFGLKISAYIQPLLIKFFTKNNQ